MAGRRRGLSSCLFLTGQNNRSKNSFSSIPQKLRRNNLAFLFAFISSTTDEQTRVLNYELALPNYICNKMIYICS